MLKGVRRCVPGLVIACTLCLVAARPAAAVCVGDCDASDTVAINEVVSCLNIFLDNSDVSSCTNCDQDGDGTVAINEVVAAVNSFLDPATCPMVMGGGPPLGVRVFSIANKPKSHFFSTGLAGGDVAAGLFLSGPLTISAGPEDANGVAQLSLQDDVVIGLSVSGSDPVCFKLLAADSHGSIDCDGGTSYGVLMTQDSNMGGDPGPTMLQTGLGDDAGAGAATLIVMGSGGQLPPGSSVNDCPSADFPEPSPIAFTTANATAQVLNPSSNTVSCKQEDGSVVISRSGKNFDCSTWTTENSNGVFATPQIGLGTVVGDTSNVVILSDNEAYAAVAGCP